MLRNPCRCFSDLSQSNGGPFRCSAMPCSDPVRTLGIADCTSNISSYKKQHHWNRALSVLEQVSMKQLELNVIPFNASISVCDIASQWQQALLLLSRLQTFVEPDIITYNSEMSSISKAARGWHFSSHLLQEVEATSLETDLFTYNSCLSSYAKKSIWEDAINLLKRMNLKTLEFDLISYSSMITAYAGSAEWQLALMSLSQVAENQMRPNLILYGAAIYACEKAAEWQQALGVLDQIQESLLQGNIVSCTA